MPLVARLEPLLETVQEMEGAAIARYWEGRRLVEAGLYDGGIYLLGFTAEMLLKTAYCRVDPNVTRNILVEARIQPARMFWQTVFGGPLPSGHNLLFLALSIEQDRPVHGRPRMPEATARLFNACVNRIAANWFVSMRYRRRAATQTEAQEVLDDVDWLRANYQSLWR